MRNWLKRLVAGKEMAELERWRLAWWLHRQWLGTFKNVTVVLESIKSQADGLANEDMPKLRSMLMDANRIPDSIGRPWLDVLAERQRQIEAEGWTPEHDDQHEAGELARAGACYAAFAGGTGPIEEFGFRWPWSPVWWKPTTRRRDLVKAGALILAEIERLDRAEAKKGGVA